MAGQNSSSSQLDPYVKPKPGKKPKAALSDPPASVRPFSANSQTTSSPGYHPPPADKQKLVLCKYFEQGECQRGSGCWFAHGRDELRNPQKHASRQQAHAPKQPQQQHQQHQALPDDEQCPDEALFKTRMCVYYQQGRCQRGSACTFAHDPSELQAYDPARRYTHQAQSSPAHTMDRFLPQKLQEAAAAATAARAKAAGTAAKSELQQESSAAGEANNNPGIFANFARDTALPSRPSPVASPSTLPKHAPVAAPQLSRPYYTPMPADIKPAGIKPKRAILQQDHEVNSSKVGLGIPSNGYQPPIEITDDIGQIEEGMEFLAVGGTDRADDDDLEAPSSFCCPITTELLRDPVVAADGHTYERQHIAEWLAKSDTSPMTNERMDHKHLIPNIVLRQVMDAYFAHGTEVVQ